VLEHNDRPRIGGPIQTHSEVPLLSSVAMRGIPIAEDSRKQRTKDCNAELNQKKRFDPKSRTVTQESHQDRNRDWKNHDEPNKVQQTN
jgi:hypothetical protein